MYSKRFNVDCTDFLNAFATKFVIGPGEKVQNCTLKFVNPVPYIPQKGIPSRTPLCSICQKSFKCATLLKKAEKAIRYGCKCDLQCHLKCFIESIHDCVWKCPSCNGYSGCLHEVKKVLIGIFINGDDADSDLLFYQDILKCSEKCSHSNPPLEVESKE
jgi:hypothetical protein